MGIELRDNRGLICGYVLNRQGPAAAIELAEAEALDLQHQLLWLHFNLNDTRACHWIAGCKWIGPEHREFLLAHKDGAALEAHDDALTGALADEFADEPERFGMLLLYLDQFCLITGRRHPLTAVQLLHQDLDRRIVVESTAALFLRLLEHLIAARAAKVATYADLINDAEDRVLVGEYVQTNLGQRRREMARLRRQLQSGRHALATLSARLPNWWDKSAAKELHRTAHTLLSVAQDLELVEERGRLLSEEIDSRLTERTNRNLYFVSIAAAVFLPITLISGIFGMNVAGLPWLEDENGFIWAIGCMLASVVIALALIRWRGML